MLIDPKIVDALFRKEDNLHLEPLFTERDVEGTSDSVSKCSVKQILEMNKMELDTSQINAACS